MFPKRAVGSVVGLGGLAGSVGGMIFMTRRAISWRSTGSYMALFILQAPCADRAYLIASWSRIQLLNFRSTESPSGGVIV